MADPFVIVGGDAAGLSAASKCKREDPEREVIVYEKGSWISYAQCGMPYYVKGEIEDLSDLLSLTPDAVANRDIDLRRNHEVVAVHPDSQTVTVEHEGTQVEQTYGDLLIATGAYAISGPIPGSSLDAAFTMHSMDSAAALRAYLTDPAEFDADTVDSEFVDRDLVEKYAGMTPPSTAAIVGGGYVGIEMAEAFRAHDLDVHLFQRPDLLLPPFGEAVGDLAADTLAAEGVTLHLDTEVQALEGETTVETVESDAGRFDVDLALVGIGIRPNTKLVADTDIRIGDSGAIAIDQYGRTNVANVYAAGDCAEMDHVVISEPTWVPLGLTANRAGRAIGQTVAGEPMKVGSVAGTAVVKAFDLECGRTGIIDHDHAREAGFDPVTETITAGSRSGYYPGGSDTTVSLTADRDTGKLLGGTIAGTDRAAIRIDTLATALEGGLTVSELERTDLAYAPPFSPVWDPILVAAKVLNGSLEVSP